MGFLKSIKISRNELNFQYKIYVDNDGCFTTTLPNEVVSIIEGSGIVLNKNRIKNSGFFIDDTLDGLKKQINNVLDEYFSMELISSKIVIQYVIQTQCAYCIDIDGEIAPNGSNYWTKTKNYKWITGTIDLHSTNRHPFGIQIYAAAFKKEIFKYKSGNEKIDYKYLNTDKLEDGTYIHHLNSFPNIIPPKHVEIHEIDYTEDAAMFFVELLNSICKINEKIKDFILPEKLQIIINNKQKLLN